MTEDTPEHLDIPEDELLKFGVSILKNELKKRGAAIYGTKEQLRERLKDALDRKVPIGGNDKAKNSGGTKKKGEAKDKSGASDKPKGMKCFADGAYWKVLDTNESPVDEPTNPTFNKPRAPTIEECDEKHVPDKFNFNEYFIRPLFSGVVHIVGKFASGIPKYSSDRSYETDPCTRNHGHLC